MATSGREGRTLTEQEICYICHPPAGRTSGHRPQRLPQGLIPSAAVVITCTRGRALNIRLPA